MYAAATTIHAPLSARNNARLGWAVALSLLLHGLLLSLQFGLPGLGLPSLEAPWNERRAQADLQITVTGAGAAAEPALPALSAPEPLPSTALSAVTGLKLYPAPKPVPPAPRNKPASASSHASERSRVARQRPRARLEQPVIALAEPQARSFAAPPPAPDEAQPETAPPEPQARVTQNDVAREEQEAAEVRDAQRREREHEAEEARRLEQEQAARLVREQQELQQKEAQRHEQAERLAMEEQARWRAEELAARQAALALEREQQEIRQHEQEQAAQRALELEARRKAEENAARLAREAVELQARKEAEEEARRQAALERQRQEEQLAARRKADEEAAREAANMRAREAALASAERPAAVPALPRDLSGGGLASRALELARRPDSPRSDAQPARTPDNTDATRRRSVFGSADRDVGLMMYIDSWRLKIERNGNLNYRQSSADKARGDPLVTVAIRSDGSVEDIVIHRSSGRAELDEAVRRIVRLNARYSAFPPELARRFDVIEIRRVWSFDDGLRIIEEIR